MHREIRNGMEVTKKKKKFTTETAVRRKDWEEAGKKESKKKAKVKRERKENKGESGGRY